MLVSSLYCSELVVKPNIESRESLRIRTESGGPSFPCENLFVRNADSTILRSVYLSNDLVKSVLTSNEPSRLRMISAGIKLATRQEGAQRAAVKAKRARGETVDADGAALDEKENPKFRVLNDAVSQVLPYMNPEDVIVGDMGVLKTFVMRTYPLAREFEEPYRERFEQCGKSLSLLDGSMLTYVVEFGHQVLRIDPPAGESSLHGGTV
jgi:hypothetical protein